LVGCRIVALVFGMGRGFIRRVVAKAVEWSVRAHREGDIPRRGLVEARWPWRS